MSYTLDSLLGSGKTPVSTADKALFSWSPLARVGETDDKQDNELHGQLEEKSATEEGLNQVGDLVLRGVAGGSDLGRLARKKISIRR